MTMEHRALSPQRSSVPADAQPDEPTTTTTTTPTATAVSTSTAPTCDHLTRSTSLLDGVDLESAQDAPNAPPSPPRNDPPSSAPAPARPATPPPAPSTTTAAAITFPPPSQQLSTPSTSALLTTPPAPLPASAPPVTRTLSSSATATSARIYGVCLVGFDHAIGPNIEFAWPPELERNDELNRNLPFLALPDGAHAREEDYSYFHLLVPSIHPRQTVFGISCNRQIPADELLNKGKDVTRSTVQKAIVVLASKVRSVLGPLPLFSPSFFPTDPGIPAGQPIFGALRDKLGVITRSFFAQRDFADKSILVDLYSSFELSDQARRAAREGERGGKGMGGGEWKGKGKGKGRAEEESTSLREFVYKFRFKTLMLLKLLMLQRRVMFFATSTPVELLCTFQYSLVALIPALLTNLEDAAAPELDERSGKLGKPSSLRTSERGSLVRYLGLPLNVFGNVRLGSPPSFLFLLLSPSPFSEKELTYEIENTQDSFFQPYLPLQQIDLLKTTSFLVGTTNSIFQQQRDCNIDVIVNIDNATLDILNPALTPLITLTAADRKWMDELVTTVEQSWDPRDPSRPQGQGFVGSEDFLRGKFEEYVCSLLACVKFGDFLANGARADMLLSAPGTSASFHFASFSLPSTLLPSHRPSSHDTRTNTCSLLPTTGWLSLVTELESYNPASFNEAFLRAFRRTKAFELWDRTTDEVIFDLVEPKHPMEGKTNPLEDVGIRLVHGLHDLHLQENLAPTREAITRGLSSGGESIWGAYRWAREEANRRTKEGPDDGGRAWVQGGLEGASKGAQSVVAGIAGGFLGAARKSGLFAPVRPAASEAAATEAARARAPSPTPSVSSATSNKSSSQLVTPTTSPSIPQGSFLRPLSTAVAAAPATPSSFSSSSMTSSAPPAPAAPPTSSLGGFFGGLRRSFIEGATPASSSASSSSSLPIPIPGLSWRNSTSSAPSPSASSSSSSASSFSASLPPQPPRTRQLTLERELRSTTGDAAITVRDLDEEAVAAARDLDKEWDERDRENGRDEARRKLEGAPA
ncbi:SPOSA6832_02416 [Sporobolomyces salmonicolor]|uniref:SPOSA6832_02416-mRNA-1:cds n=1 Tax=Sporidiobolus salmonicolor TaxID=5005 RepID=A0A0D6EM18_SPOSA|nr:SPOSA6832_02416 [Sporobolomyces salmonicolor]